MNILTLADIHSELSIVDKILSSLKKEPDLVVCQGNMTDMFKISPDFSQLDMAEIIIQKFFTLKKPILCVPGNHDPYDILGLFNEYNINIHGKYQKISNYNFIGFGGASTPFNTLFEPTEEETKESLERLPSTQPLILITHNPPKNTKLDKIASGEHVGSLSIHNFIISKKPILNLTAHIHEAAGEDMLGQTKLFNPGPVVEGKYGIVTIEKNTITCKQYKIK